MIAVGLATAELLVARACGAVPDALDVVAAVVLAGALGLVVDRARRPAATAAPLLVYGAGVLPAVLLPGLQTLVVTGCLAIAWALVARRLAVTGRAVPARAQVLAWGALVAVAWAHAAWVEGRPPPGEVVVAGAAAILACAALGKWAPLLAPLAFWPLTGEAWTAAGPAPTGRDVVLVTVDTLRVDAARAMRHLPGPVHAVQSAAPWTLPALASIHTGRSPGEHGAVRVEGGYSALRAEVPTLAERFSAAGWDTAATVESPFADPSFGLARGFARYRADAAADWVVPRRPEGERARPVAAQALAAMGLLASDPWGADARVADVAALLEARRERPLFLWVHLLDAHLPYRHAADASLRGATRVSLLHRLDAPLLERLRAAYAHEVTIVDDAIARIRAAAPDALVVVTSDHGEEFGEHGGFEHGHSMYQEVVAVPLASNEPALAGVGASQELGDALLAVAGVPGAAWTPAPDAPRATTNPLYGPLDLRAVRVGDRKRIVSGDGSLTFDLAADPGELRPLADDQAVDDGALDALVPAVPSADGVSVPISEGMRAQLEALGYVE